MKTSAWIIVLALAFPGAALAENESNVARAKALFEAGSRAYKSGNYPVAAVAMGEAYALAPRPAVAFSLAQANRMQFLSDGDPQKLKRAVELYSEYLAREPSGNRRAHAEQHLSTMGPVLARLQRERPEAFAAASEDKAAKFLLSATVEGAKATIDGQEVDELPEIINVQPGKHEVLIEAPGYHEKRISSIALEGQLVPVSVELEPLPAKVIIRCEQSADIYVDGLPRGRTPLLAPLEISAGTHILVVAARGKAAHRSDLDLTRGQEVTLDVSLSSTGQRKWAWGLVATSVALAGGGLGATIVALGKQADARELEDQLVNQSLTTQEVDQHVQLEEQRDSAANVSVGLLGAAVATGVASALLFVLDTPDVPAVSTSVQLAPGASAADWGATLQLQF